MATWRQHFRPYIAAVILENRDKTGKEIRQALRHAKPDSARSYSSVNAVWLSEVKRQLAALFPETQPTPTAGQPAADGDGQMNLF
ncbi:MAG: hypothetical protein U0U46_16270 [Saprospiraceae bacterium]